MIYTAFTIYIEGALWFLFFVALDVRKEIKKNTPYARSMNDGRPWITISTFVFNALIWPFWFMMFVLTILKRFF